MLPAESHYRVSAEHRMAEGRSLNKRAALTHYIDGGFLFGWFFFGEFFFFFNFLLRGKLTSKTWGSLFSSCVTCSCVSSSLCGKSQAIILATLGGCSEKKSRQRSA